MPKKKAAKRLPSSVSKRWKAKAQAHQAEEEAWELVELLKRERATAKNSITIINVPREKDLVEYRRGDLQASKERGGGNSTGTAHTERNSSSGTNEIA